MMKLTNNAKGLRGVTVDGETLWIEPGQTVEVKSLSAADKAALDGLGVAADGGPLDHDKDGRKGGSVASETEEKRGPGRPPKSAKD